MPLITPMVPIADTDADISGINDIIFYLDLSQIKTGDKLVFGDPASDGVEVGLDNITNPSDPVSFDGTTIAAINDRTIDAMFGDGQYIVIQVSAQSANAITQLMETGMKFSGSVAGDRDFHFLNTGLQPLATATVTVEAGGGGGAIVLDLDQVGTGNADTNNSTAVYDWDIPAYIADSGSVLGNDAPAEYKKLTISFDTADWTEDWYAYDADRTANGVIVDPGGTGENSLLPYVLENTVEVGSVVLVNTDKVNGTIGYAITGGADQARFRIDANTGVLVFIDRPGNPEQGQPRGSQAPGQRGAIDKLGKPSLAKQFDRHGPAARHAETNELILAARKAVQALSLSGRA